jgi:hypothetical protein
MADVGLTLLTCWVPGGGLIAMAGAMAIQAPAVYQPLAREIAKAYLVNDLDSGVRACIADAAIQGAEWDIAGAFGIGFFQEIIGEVLQEIGLGAALGVLPFVGTAVAAIYDAKIAATLTWRVGLCAALYYENGCEWLGDRKSTYERARRLVGEGLSAKTANRADLGACGRNVPGLRDRQASLFVRYLDLAKNLVGLEALERTLRSKHRLDPELIEAVLVEVRRRRISDGRPSAAAKGRYQRCTDCGEQYLFEERVCPHCRQPASAAAASQSVKALPISDRARLSVAFLRAAGLSDNAIFEKCTKDFSMTPEQARAALAA